MLLQIPEHTWGFDTKTFLHDNANWSNAQFHAQLEAHADNYEANIAQWKRQRGYLSWALEALDLAPSNQGVGCASLHLQELLIRLADMTAPHQGTACASLPLRELLMRL